MTNLEQKIIKTLSFFDIFDHALTSRELYQWLWRKNQRNYFGFISKLKKQQAPFSFSEGFITLKGREGIAETRQKRVSLAKEKMDIAKKAALKLRWVPFLEAVFVCNTLSLGSVKEDSDIDFFIVVKDNRVWLVRFFANIILKLFRLRVEESKKADNICLTFFISSNNLNLSEITELKPDVYLIYWLDQLLPIYDPKGFYSKIQQKNQWLNNYLPNKTDKKEMIKRSRIEDNLLSKNTKKVLELVWGGYYGNLLDNQSKKLQEMRLKKYLGEDYKQREPNVIIKKNIIKLHEDDKRKHYKSKWKRICNEYI